MLLLVPNQEVFFAQESDPPKGFFRFVRRLWPLRGHIIQASIYAQIIGLLSLASPFLIQILTDDVLVTLEWVGSNGENEKGEGIFFPLSLVSKGTYFKPSSQSKFKKQNSLGVGFNIDVKF